ncbi:MFS transporter [Pseudomonas sp. R2.Fl]|nr:MFS transporter [Pseudomonas sp. R2.Fl]
MDFPSDETVADTRSGWAELLEPRYAATSLMLCIGVALYAFNGFLVSTALPTAVAELGGAALMSWSLSLYLGASIVAGACAALLKQRFGARTTLLAAAVVFLAGTLTAGTALTMQAVLAGRLLQGFGEGLVAALCYALIPDMFPSRLVPKVFGIEAGVWATAAFGGPLVAGLLTEHFSWRMAFHINLPIIAIFAVLATVIAPRRDPAVAPQPFRLPGLRLFLLCLGLGGVMAAAVLPDVRTAAPLIAGAAACFLILVRIDHRSGNAILPGAAFSVTRLPGLGLWIVLLMAMAQATSSVYLVFVLQNLWGFSPTLAGALNALMAISWSLSAIAIANVRDTKRQGAMLWAGPLLQVIGLAGILTGIILGALIPIVAGQVLIGTGFGISWAFLSHTSMRATPDHERDKTSALLPTLQSAGFAVGAALCGLAANAGGLAAYPAGEAVRLPIAMAFGLAVLWALPAVAAGWGAARRTTGAQE